MKRKKIGIGILGIGLLITGGVLTIKRHLFLKELKEELGIIPWDTEKVTWKHFFKSYLKVS